MWPAWAKIEGMNLYLTVYEIKDQLLNTKETENNLQKWMNKNDGTFGILAVDMALHKGRVVVGDCHMLALDAFRAVCANRSESKVSENKIYKMTEKPRWSIIILAVCNDQRQLQIFLCKAHQVARCQAVNTVVSGLPKEKWKVVWWRDN